MKIEQYQWSASRGWEPEMTGRFGRAAQVVFLFGNARLIQAQRCASLVRKIYPEAHLFGCSTGGEIQGARVGDDTLALTAVAFEHTRINVGRVAIAGPEASFEAGARLIGQFDPAGLRHVFVLSEGLLVNGSDFVGGINSALPAGVTTSGGFAADGDRLQTTYVWCDGEPQQSAAVALGFYGDRLKVGVSATGGWGPFGPDRLITRSHKNVLYEFDGKPALALYKQYLGEYAAGLPASGLMFPIELRVGEHQQRVLRALLAIDEKEQSITFAGNVPEGSYARFMVGHIEDLIDGTVRAAQTSLERLGPTDGRFSLLVSCNARRAVLKQRVEEEVEAVREIVGDQTPLTGFYSYGEIAPLDASSRSELHNETMTITNFAEG